MIESSDFLKSILNSVSEHIVVIDQHGAIQFVNQAWVKFGQENCCKIDSNHWQTVNYLAVCDASGSRGEKFGRTAAAGIRRVIGRASNLFNVDYPCHSPTEKRWFTMSVTPLEMSGTAYFAISHKNITERKLAEDRVLGLSRIDGLTGIPNRRYFDQFLAEEWRRCARLKLPISVAIMDIDHFKRLNDHYGHPSGDACLVKIGQLLNKTEKRPGDLFARYGGEEFVFVFGGVSAEQASIPLSKIVDNIRNLKIPNEMSPTDPYVTVSAGLATLVPDTTTNEKELVKEADTRLYSAKHTGRDRIVSSPS